LLSGFFFGDSRQLFASRYISLHVKLAVPSARPVVRRGRWWYRDFRRV